MNQSQDEPVRLCWTQDGEDKHEDFTDKHQAQQRVGQLQAQGHVVRVQRAKNGKFEDF